MLIIWIIIFIVSLSLLVKSADWLLSSSEKIGLSAGLSPFIVGVTIVGFGTSVPELISGIVAVFQGVPELVVANAVGSNIANIFLIVGVSVIVAKKLSVTKNLIDLDLPLLALSTAIFFVMAWDGTINFFESLILLITYGIYLGFSIMYKEIEIEGTKTARPRISGREWIFLFMGIVGLAFGAKYLIDSVIVLSDILNVGAGIIAITAVALGTSLPELLVSVKAVLRHKHEVALGNVFGSNIFNVLVVVGLPGVFGVLTVDSQTMRIGLPMLILATSIFIVSGISRRIHIQEGVLYVMLYLIFTAKLFNLF